MIRKTRFFWNSVAAILSSTMAFGQTTSIVSQSVTGGAGNGASHSVAATPDGRWVAFLSTASDLVVGGTNAATNVYVFDRWTLQARIASVTSAGGLVPSFAGSVPSLTNDGDDVVFENNAWQLTGSYSPSLHIYLHSFSTGATVRLTDGANNHSFAPSISASGQILAFETLSTNLVPVDSNGVVSDIVVLDRSTIPGTFSLATISSSGVQSNQGGYRSMVSGNGRYVVFESSATNLSPAATNQLFQIYRHDRLTGETLLVSTDPTGLAGNGNSAGASVSADGRYVAFYGFASNLVASDPHPGLSDVFVRDMDAGFTTLISTTLGPHVAGESAYPQVSADGEWVAFWSNWDDVVPGDLNQRADVFAWCGATGSLELVSLANDGSQASGPQDSLASNIGVADGGRFIAWTSYATNLVPDDTNGLSDVFLRDRATPLFVDAGNTGFEDGSPLTPFNTLSEAVAVLAPKGWIEVAGGAYPENGQLPLRVTKPMTIDAHDGDVVVGGS